MNPSSSRIFSIVSARTGASVVSAITACSPPGSAPTAAEMMFTASSPKQEPTRPIIPGRSA